MVDLDRRQFMLGASVALAAPAIARAATSGGARISVADYGARPDGITDATGAIRAAIAACALDGGVLHFPGGTYLCKNTSSSPFIAFSGLSNFTVDGGGSSLMFEGDATGLAFSQMRRIELRDLTIDWSRPAFSQAVVIPGSFNGNAVDLDVAPEFPVTGTELIRAVYFYDRATGAPATSRSANHRLQVPANVQLVGPQRLRLEFAEPFHDAGDVVVLLHGRGYFGLLIEKSQDIALANVRIYAAPGMGISGGRVTNVAIDRCQVVPRPGSGRLMSSGADGLHFWDSSGSFSITRCDFAGTGDDCINIHSFFLEAEVDPGSTALEFSPANQINGHPRAVEDSVLPTAGEELEIVAPITLVPEATGAVATMDLSGGPRRATLQSPLDLPPGDEVLVDDLNRTPSHLAIQSCTFRAGVGRAIITHAQTTISGNKFSDMAAVAIKCGVNPTWLEGPLVSNVFIENNDFTRCGLISGGSVWAYTLRVDGKQSREGDVIEFDNLRIAGNNFVDPYSIPIIVGETRNFAILNNVFTASDDDPNPHPAKISIRLDRVGAGTIAGNSCPGGDQLVSIDAVSTQVQLGSNPGFTVHHR